MIPLEVSCQSNEVNVFNAKNIRQCERYVRSMQRKLDKAIANGDTANIRWFVHLLSKRSFAVKILAVNRVTRINDGKKTAGIDGEALPDEIEHQDEWRHKILSEIDVKKKPDAIRRVFIPKSNGKRRPLGIPTVKDRIVQDILRIALEPITEYHFNEKSFGFRPKRCTQDAIEDLFVKLSRKTSRTWIVEGDIKGCFDHIDHNHILEKLKEWKTPEWAQKNIGQMLKSKIFDNGEAFPSDEGTPQGGIISPMLANVALTSLDEYCQEKFGWKGYTKERGPYKVNPITRYADDFVILCKTKKEAEFIKEDVKNYIKKEIGLELSEDKTKITHISKGFDFLGFNLRKYDENSGEFGTKAKRNPQKELIRRSSKEKWENHKLIIKPSKDKVTQFLRECKRVIRQNRQAPQEILIRKLNEKLRGWGNYYRYVCSSRVFNKVDHEAWWKLYKWAKRRHPRKSTSWVMRRYFGRIGNQKNVFRDKEKQQRVINTSSIPCSKRWIKVNSEYRVHEGGKAIEYWQKREFMNGKDSIFGSKEMKTLYRQQKGKCPYCGQQIKETQIKEVQVHKHHMKPRSLNGDSKLSNLRLLHQECHTEIHAKIPRSKMAEFIQKGIDYVKLLKRTS